MGPEKFKGRIDQVLNDYIAGQGHMQELLLEALFPGRRSRPTLFYSLIGHSKKISRKDVDNVALALELNHRASIILDDLIDDDSLRRRQPTFHVVHGMATTLLVANHLIISSFEYLSYCENSKELIAIFSLTGQKMVEGQLADIGKTKNYTYDDYRNNLLPKTSSLYAAAFSCAAMMNDLDVERINLYERLGNHLGSYYQMRNDIYDESMASKDERGAKSKWRFSFSLLKAIAFDACSEEHRNQMISLYEKRYISNAQYQKFQSDFMKEGYLSTAFKLADEFKRKIISLVEEIGSPGIKENVLHIITRMENVEYHNHYEYKKAGY